MLFSSMLKVVTLIEDVGLVSEEESVVVFRATDSDAAMKKVIDIARRSEERYRNPDGKRVRNVVSAIGTLDLLEESDDLGDSREVYFRVAKRHDPPDSSVPFEVQFNLEASEPGVSGV